jgi:N-hydroxyarylamine O-acetyltransferase
MGRAEAACQRAPVREKADPMAFDLSAYLERIHLPALPSVDAAGLRALQRAHRLASPFENLDVLLGRPIRIDGEGVFAKLVTARRGGYCFEHNRLFGDALAALGFEARPILARTWLGREDVPPLTHTLSLVTFGSARWIADCGFGGSYAPAMPLVDGAEADAPDGARFRLTGDEVGGWLLERRGDPATTDGRSPGPGWQRQYGFTTAPVFPSDLLLGNHWASTAPDTRFTTHAIVSLVLPNGFASLTDRSYRRRNGAAESTGEITDPRQYRMRLSLLFGIDLTPDEVAGLGLFPAVGST